MTATLALATVSCIVEPRLRRLGPRDEATDVELVEAIAKQDQLAFAAVYERLAPAVHGTALRVLGDRGRAEDVTQGVFLALWQGPGRYDPSRGTLRALLVAMAHHRAIDAVRSEQSRQRREDRHGRPDPSATSDLVGDAICADESVAAVRDALAALDADERQAIELAYFGGRTYREVSRELNLPEGTVKSRIRRGMDRLRNAVHARDDQ